MHLCAAVHSPPLDVSPEAPACRNPLATLAQRLTMGVCWSLCAQLRARAAPAASQKGWCSSSDALTPLGEAAAGPGGAG